MVLFQQNKTVARLNSSELDVIAITISQMQDRCPGIPRARAICFPFLINMALNSFFEHTKTVDIYTHILVSVLLEKTGRHKDVWLSF